MAEVLVDTSAWISYFRHREDPVSRWIAELVARDRAVLTGPVISELVQGLKTEREEKTLEKLLPVLTYVEVERDDWQQAGSLLRKLRAQGITVPLTDAVIATVAQRNGLAVLTLDQHFKHLDVELVSPPEQPENLGQRPS